MKLQSIFVGLPRTVSHQGKEVSTGIFKEEIKGVVKVNQLNIEGDQQADLTVHGGINKAVYVYAAEHYDFWKKERSDLVFSPGVFGENLSVTGLDKEDEVFIGDEFKIGTTIFAVTSPRLPCFKLGIKMNDNKFVKDFMQAERTGFYFKVLTEGQIQPGNSIEQLSSDPNKLSVRDIVRLYGVEKNNKSLLEKAVNTSALPEDWREFFQKKLEKL